MKTIAQPLFLAAAALLAANPVSASVQLIDAVNGDYRIDTVTGVVVNGITYDAKFNYGVSYDQFLVDNPGEPTFTNSTDAAIANRRFLSSTPNTPTSILNQIESSGIDFSTSAPGFLTRTSDYTIATGVNAVDAAFYDASFSFLENLSGFIFYDEFGFFSPAGPRDLVNFDEAAFVSFTVASGDIPEPTTALMAWTFFACCGIMTSVRHR